MRAPAEVGANASTVVELKRQRNLCRQLARSDLSGTQKPSVTLLGCIRGEVRRVGRVGEVGLAGLDRRGKLPGLLSCPSVGARSAAGEMDSPAVEFEEEEHVETSEPERFDGEKVAGDDRVGVRTQEGAS